MFVLVLLRHGESAWNAAEVFTGWIDVELSEEGEQQARQAGKHLDTVSDEAAAGLEVPNAVPLCYEFQSGTRPGLRA